MPHVSSSKRAYFYIMSTALVVCAILALAFLIHVDYESVKEPSDKVWQQERQLNVGPNLQNTLDSMARSFQKWDR